MLSLPQPAFPDIGVVAYVPDDWDWKWQQRHQILSRLCRYFPVVWVCPPYDWQEALGIRRARPEPPAPPLPGPGFQVLAPTRWLPRFYSPPSLVSLTERRWWFRARSRLVRRGCCTIIAYLWRPEYGGVIDFGGFDLSCYHVDDEYTFAEKEQPISSSERRLLERAGQVFIHSPALLRKKGGFNPNTIHMPNGVDYSSFASPTAEPKDIAPIPHPRIGYAGWLKPQLDWQLLAALADRHPTWQFVFVGAIHSREDNVQAVRTLQSRSNVHILGSKDTPELSRYPQHFDVSIMPYRIDDYTKFIYPLKIHEYFAAGKPVVGTRLPSLQEFPQYLEIPDSLDEWSDALARSLDPQANTPARVRRRQEIAHSHDWNILTERIAQIFMNRLGPSFTERFAQTFPVQHGHEFQESAHTSG